MFLSQEINFRFWIPVRSARKPQSHLGFSFLTRSICFLYFPPSLNSCAIYKHPISSLLHSRFLYLQVYSTPMADTITYQYNSPSGIITSGNEEAIFLSKYSEVEKKEVPCFFGEDFPIHILLPDA